MKAPGGASKSVRVEAEAPSLIHRSGRNVKASLPQYGCLVCICPSETNTLVLAGMVYDPEDVVIDCALEAVREMFSTGV